MRSASFCGRIINSMLVKYSTGQLMAPARCSVSVPWSCCQRSLANIEGHAVQRASSRRYIDVCRTPHRHAAVVCIVMMLAYRLPNGSISGPARSSANIAYYGSRASDCVRGCWRQTGTVRNTAILMSPNRIATPGSSIDED
jgi:hypothetical protein